MVAVRPAARWWALWQVLLLCLGASAQQLSLESAGARVGGSPTESAHFFHQAEGFLNFNLPWAFDLGKEWWLKSRLDFSLGWLGDHGEDSVVGSAGPSLLLGRKRLPLSAESGVGPTLLSEFDFPDKDFGGILQFTSYVGLNVELPAHLRLSYRFQHMSNGGLNGHNPGLNLHMVALSYRF